MADRYVGELRVLEQINPYEFAFEADILRTGPVQGGRWEFANLEKNYMSFAGRPVLIAYVGSRVGDGHNASERVDTSTGERYRSFTDSTAERIIGTIGEEDDDLSLYEQDGYQWLKAKGRIWKYYAKEAVDTIVRTGRMDVSIEAEVHDIREVEGREVYDNWTGIGLTILGEGVDPAVPGANIRALADMEEEFESMKLRVASLVKENANKPQKSSTKKGLNNFMNFSKPQHKELQEKFGAEVKVLDARKLSDDTTRVMLMRKSDFAFLSYDMGANETAISPEKYIARAAYITFAAEEGEEQMCADAGETICEECAEANAAKECAENRAECAEKELTAAKETIAKMEAAENSRRLSAAKAKATATLEAFNANRADKVDVKALEALNKDIEAGKFTALCDENGVWTGENAIEEKVLSLCATAVMEIDRKHAASEPMTWGNVKKASAAPGTIGELFAHKK